MAQPKILKMNSDGTRDMGKRMALSFKRANAVGFDWVKVSEVELLAALTVVINSGVAIMFSQASGGKGVCLKIFDGDQKAVEYAGIPEELDNMLGQIVDHYGSSSEDTRQNIAMGVRLRKVAG